MSLMGEKKDPTPTSQPPPSARTSTSASRASSSPSASSATTSKSCRTRSSRPTWSSHRTPSLVAAPLALSVNWVKDGALLPAEEGSVAVEEQVVLRRREWGCHWVWEMCGWKEAI